MHEALVAGGPWGETHLHQLAEFLKNKGLLTTTPAHGPLLSKLLTDPDWPIASYWPIGSELKLIPEPKIASTRWWLPEVVASNNLAWFALTKDVIDWPRNKLGLPLPPPSWPLLQDLELLRCPLILITPCLAVDCQGIRLGYGGGYYDRFLAQHQNRLLSIACVSNALFIREGALPRDAHDQPVDVVITEKATWIVSPSSFEIKIKQLFNC
jgi:5,10-methenyltetrahydrofolate synthetase